MFSRLKRRRLDPLETVFIQWRGCMQLSLEFDTPANAKRAVEELIKSQNCLHTSAGWFFISETKTEPEVIKIPSHLNTLPEINDWIYREHTPPFRRALGSIAMDETRVVLNTSHVCGDGSYMKRIVEHLSNPSETWERAPIPMAPSEYYYDEIMRTKTLERVPGQEPRCCRLFNKLKCDKPKNATYQIGVVRRPAHELTCWSPEKKRLVGLSESLWTAMGLMAAAQIGKFHDTFAVLTCVDMLGTVPEKDRQNRALQNFFADVRVRAKPTMDMTVGELGRHMRASFNECMARKDYHAYMKGMWRLMYRFWQEWHTPPGLGYEMSSIGPIHIKRPVKDAYISLSTPDRYDLGSLCFMSYSIIDEFGRNEFIGHTQYNTQEMAKKEGDMFTRGLDYALCNLRPETTLGDAIAQLQQFVPKSD